MLQKHHPSFHPFAKYGHFVLAETPLSHFLTLSTQKAYGTTPQPCLFIILLFTIILIGLGICFVELSVDISKQTYGYPNLIYYHMKLYFLVIHPGAMM